MCLRALGPRGRGSEHPSERWCGPPGPQLGMGLEQGGGVVVAGFGWHRCPGTQIPKHPEDGFSKKGSRAFIRPRALTSSLLECESLDCWLGVPPLPAERFPEPGRRNGRARAASFLPRA